ncbi:MAG: hypothetical protein C7B43_19170 [Sulfobacillus benefaciens]|uniref:Uncharacterized protein n=1 Tax=Sulfobacillus benefaciens TaxID=453960 RepID=A0A2T2WQ67_9FIRM|nr:MAG: hypothetical protein C7B43_19170 [Sulfobacillus benefaciens]HBQ94800.1 hypothetical protein [Sulfobacillus sp.]
MHVASRQALAIRCPDGHRPKAETWHGELTQKAFACPKIFSRLTRENREVDDLLFLVTGVAHLTDGITAKALL